MNLIIVPLRFPAAWPPSLLGIGTQLFAHVMLVGIPTALIARRYLRRAGYLDPTEALVGDLAAEAALARVRLTKGLVALSNSSTVR